ncbi:hypothetical protein ABH935_005687 [Catenulispora sp. GAS73]|uniref:hypothetical protein n=1 Tax=Catenulispora sp. GAS73 TaxID=3156269 RepID=UPI0035192D22
MLSGPVLAAVLRQSHYQLKRFASDFDSQAQPYQVIERKALGPTWQYGEEAEPVRYHDGQCLVLTDGRVVVVELQVVFEQDRVTVDGRLGIEAYETDDPGDGGVFDLLIDAGPRWARTDEETIAAIGETVSEILSRPSLLEELGVPVRS